MTVPVHIRSLHDGRYPVLRGPGSKVMYTDVLGDHDAGMLRRRRGLLVLMGTVHLSGSAVDAFGSTGFPSCSALF